MIKPDGHAVSYAVDVRDPWHLTGIARSTANRKVGRAAAEVAPVLSGPRVLRTCYATRGVVLRFVLTGRRTVREEKLPVSLRSLATHVQQNT